VINVIIAKYKALLIQRCEDGIDIPVTKEFYIKYKANSSDKFVFNSTLLKDM